MGFSVPPVLTFPFIFRDSLLEKRFVCILTDKDGMWIPCKTENNLELAVRQLLWLHGKSRIERNAPFQMSGIHK